jgi:hypothetical protein
MAPMSFKQFVNVDYTQTGDGQLAYNAKKRKTSIDTSEALDASQRRKLAMRMKRNKARIAMGRKRAERKTANMDTLKKRAKRQARIQFAKKLTKGIPKGDLTVARRKEIEKRLDKPALKNRIDRVARRLIKTVRKQEMERKRAKRQGGAKK